MKDLLHVIEEAREKQIEILIGEPHTERELDDIAAEFGVRFPADYRRVLTTVGALSFRKDRLHYFAYGKPSAATIEGGVALGLLEAGRALLNWPLPFAPGTTPTTVVPVAGKVDPDHGHSEMILVDADGQYRTLFMGGAVSEPRMLLSVEGIFPWFVSMFHRDGTRLTSAELLEKLNADFT